MAFSFSEFGSVSVRRFYTTDSLPLAVSKRNSKICAALVRYFHSLPPLLSLTLISQASIDLARLCRNIIISSNPPLTAFFFSGTSMALTAFMFKARTWLDLHSNHVRCAGGSPMTRSQSLTFSQGLFTATFSLSVASDFAITTVLSFYLRLARTGSKR